MEKMDGGWFFSKEKAYLDGSSAGMRFRLREYWYDRGMSRENILAKERKTREDNERKKHEIMGL